MTKKIRTTVCLAALFASSVYAEPLPVPGELATGASLSATQISDAEWTLGPSGTLANGGISVVSEKSNPTLKFKPSLAGDILIQARLLNASANHNIRLIINGRVSLGFHRQLQRITLGLVEVTAGATPLAEIFYVNGAIPAANPDDFVLSVALRADELIAWIDNREIARTKVSGLSAPYSIGFASGWSSQWTLADFTASSLR